MAKKVFKNPGKIIRDDSGKPILDKNGNYVYAPQSGRTEQTMAPYEYLIALPENALADAVFGLAGKIASPFIKKAASKAIPKIISKVETPKFISDINWGKWNKEIPDNPKLLNEYHNIEKTAKESGNWMKNPDGSDFTGTPEQFVQQNSINFKKAFPDYYGKILNHNSNNKFNQFSRDYFGTASDNGWYGEGVYMHPSKEYTKPYGDINYELYVNSKNKGFITNDNYDISSKYSRDYAENLKQLRKKRDSYIDEIHGDSETYNDQDFFKKQVEKRYASERKKMIRDYIEAKKSGINKYTTLENQYNGEIVVPFKNYPKSAIGNNGMFDMTNPNIYKGLVPIGAGLGAYKSNENNKDMDTEYKSGGWIQNAVNPKHKGFCTPMTKSTCTPRRKAFAMTMKKHHGFHADGGELFGTDGYQDHGFGMTQPDYADSGNMYFLGGVKSPTTIQGSAGNVAGSIGGMIPTDTRGGAAGAGALKGAELGMNFGPWGAAAGAAILGTAGFINQGNKMKRADFATDNLAMKQRNELLNIKALGGFITASGVPANMATEYAQGGLLTEFNSGLSHEENKFGGVLQGYNEDGEPNRVEQGETKYQDYIFSDRLKLDEQAVNDHNLPKSMINKTFAEASKRISKLHKERPNDPITRDTMKSKMDHLMKANDEIREYEQSSMMAMGGHLYKDGAPLLIGNKLVDVNKPQNNETLASRIGDSFINPSSGLLPTQNQTQKLETGKLQSKINSTEGLNGKTDLGFFRDPKNLRYAPIAFDALAATGLFGKSPKPETYSPTTIRQQGSLTAPQINEEAMRAKIDAAYQNQIRGLAGASGGSVAALRSGLTGLGSDYMSAVGQGFLGAETANNQTKMQADQYNLGTAGNIAAQNAQIQNQGAMYNNQLLNQNRALNYDTRMSYLGKGAEGIGDIGYEQRNAEILPRLYGYNQYGQYAPINAKACGGRLRMLKRKK